jgi:hypothetical protein
MWALKLFTSLYFHKYSIVEDQANNTRQYKLRDVLSRSANSRLTIKQAQLNSRILSIQFGGFSVYLFRRFAPLQYKCLNEKSEPLGKSQNVGTYTF